jgi:uncharacterized delta-60 repeat protein
VWVPQSSQTDVPFSVNRTFAGALTVHATSLPDGVTAKDVVLSGDEASGSLTLVASSASTLAATSDTTIELLENAQVDDQATITVGVSGLPGTLDTTWGKSGVVTLPPLGNPTSGYVLDVDSHGRVVYASTLVSSNSDVDIVIARYNTDGSLDTTFGDKQSGYTLYWPLTSANDKVPTEPLGLRVDSQDRIVMTDSRYDPAQLLCATDVRRFTASGAIDTSFPYYERTVNGTGFCGAPAGLTILPSGEIVVLANYWDANGMEALLQLFDPSSGAPTTTYHLELLTGSSSSNQHLTQMFDFAVDDRGGFVLGGRLYSGSGWVPTNAPIYGAIARVGADGQRDNSFATNAYTTYDPSVSQIFWHVAIDPASKDIIGVGENADETHAVIVRLDGTTGQPAGFGQLPLDVCPGGTAQDLTQVMVDCRSRIIATGPCPKDGLAHIATVRTSIDGVVDTQFGSAGLVQGNPRGAKLAPDERIYVVGDSDTTAAIWRFWP